MMHIYLHLDEPQQVLDAKEMAAQFGVWALAIRVGEPVYVNANGTAEQLGNWLKAVEERFYDKEGE